MKKILLAIILILLVSTTYALPQELEPSIEMDKVSSWTQFWRALIPGDSLSTQQGPGERYYLEEGELYTIEYTTRCINYAGTKHRYTFDYKEFDKDTLFNKRQTFTIDKSCNIAELFDTKMTNVKMPALTSNFCGNVIHIMIKHEIYSNGVWQVDTDGSGVDGFERIASAQYECAASACDGLTGKWASDYYCSGKDKTRDKYGTIVRNDECFGISEVIENCRYGCEDNDCVRKIEGYIISSGDNIAEACYDSTYLSNTREPSGFYSTLAECEANLAGEEFIDDTIVDEEVVVDDTTVDEEVISTNETVVNNTESDINTETNKTKTDSGEDKVGFWEGIWNWLKRLFS